MSDAQEFFAAVLDDEGRIAADVYCVNCRYNLRALSPGCAVSRVNRASR
jgi:hypothetical protein